MIRFESWRYFLISYILYALLYLARLNFSVTLPLFSAEFSFSKFILGLVSGTYSISYAVGQFVHGQLVERYGPKRILIFGLLLSALMNLFFGSVNSLVLFMTFWAVNGFAQAAGWPSVIKLISSSYSFRLGTIGGIFGSCFLVGNVIAWPIIGYIVSICGWRMAFTVPAVILVILAFLVYFFVKDVRNDSVREKGFVWIEGFKRLFSSRNIVVIAFAFVFLQFVRSVFTLWAPTYLFEQYDLSLELASYFAVAIPLGGIFGSIFSGWFLDRLKNFGIRFVLCFLVLILSFVTLVLYYATFLSLNFVIFLLFLIGFSLYGPHVIMSTVVPMEFNKAYGGASVAGFIDGLGYLGLMFADSFTGWLIEVYDWNGAIIFCFISSMFALILLASFYKGK
ncbi:MAG: MFS transporter [Nitrososphaeria archaeon]|nr:MFS transporter [Nitrososphaeria archaeon]